MSVFLLYITATTVIYTYSHTLSLHDALSIWLRLDAGGRDDSGRGVGAADARRRMARRFHLLLPALGQCMDGIALDDSRARDHWRGARAAAPRDRKSTRLNSSH